MIRKRVVFIVGAGCSAPYGFPTGAGLVQDVVTETAEPSRQLFAALASCGHDSQLIHDFHHDLRRARPASIDRFLVARPVYAALGKQAIVARLTPLEIPEMVLKDGPSDQDWLHYLQSRVLAGRDFEEALANNVTFITFNFDRVIEFSLYSWLRNMYGATPSEAARGVAKFGVTHVHGQLGACAWSVDEPNARAYQPDRYAGEHLVRIAGGLHIIGDGVADEPTAQVKAVLADAEEVCFLGFGYDRTNLEWLMGCGLGRQNLVRMGTMLGMTTAEVSGALERQIVFPNPTWGAKQFLRESSTFHA